MAWDPDTEADLAGYKVYYGTSARTGTDPKSCGLCGYSTIVPVGNATAQTIKNLVSGQTYYFSVTAFDTSNNESGFSNEVSGAATDPTPTQYTLTVNINGPGSVTKYPDKSAYNQGKQVILTATPSPGFTFNNWSGDVSGTANPITLTMNGTKTVTANFTPNPIPPPQYTLAVNIVGSGSVTKNPNKSSYNQGEMVTLTATPDSGYSLVSWSGDVSGTTNPVTLTMNGNEKVTATFSQISPSQCTLVIIMVGSGLVTKNPDKLTYNPGEQVTLTATPGSGFAFGNWSGDASGTTNPVTLAMNGNKTVTANFVPTGSFEAIPLEGLSTSGRQGGTFSPSSQTYTLRNRGQIPIKWKISKKPKWVTLSLTSGSLAAGEGVQVEVSINSSAKQLKMGSYNDAIVFSNASNGKDSLSRSAAITVSPPIKTYTVKTKPGGLQIIVDGVAYSSPQTFEWEVGSSHTLDTPSPQTSTPGTQSVFSSWSNRQSQKQTITASSFGTTYTANFKTQYVLTTSVNPSEGGSLTPTGTNWFNQRQRVSAAAKPTEGYQFINWSGDASGSRSSITVTMEKPMNLVANFAKIGTPGVNDAYASVSMKSTTMNLPIVGVLESPSDGKRVLGQKTIYGWALDGEGISKVKLFIDREYICDIPYGGLREDLKEIYPGYPNAEKGGFALIWNYSSLSPGGHLVQIEIQNTKGEFLRLGASITVHQFPGDLITQVNPNEWLIPGVNLTVDGNTKTYDLKLEWSNESQAFEIIDLFSP